MPSNNRSALAVAALFFVNGSAYANFLPRIAEVRDGIGASNALLGTALLGAGFGGLFGSFFVARLLDRFGSKRCVLVGASIVPLTIPLIALAPSAWVLLLVLTLFGLADIVTDMAMNSQGVVVQDRLGRLIMNRLHGAWSIGFLLGAIFGSFASGINLGLVPHFTGVAIAMLATLWSVQGWLISDEPNTFATPTQTTGSQPTRVGLQRIAVFIAVAAVGAAFVEGTSNDWSTVFLNDILHAKYKGLGTVAFAIAMTVGRLSGDHAIEWFGAPRVLSGALVLTSVGVGVVVLSPGLVVALVGFAIWGLGVSVLFPQLYDRAARLPGVTSGAGLAAMAVGQRSGFMVGPFIIGAIADAVNLRVAFAVVIATAVALLVISNVASTVASTKSSVQQISA